jgi:hypothetical protein
MEDGMMRLLMMVVFSLSLPLSASAAETLNAAEIEALVNDKTWEMRIGKRKDRMTFWDWKRGGTLCARILEAPRADKCADDGQWRIEGDQLCWKLTWFGSAGGLKTQCVSIRRNPSGLFEAVAMTSAVQWFFEFAVID